MRDEFAARQRAITLRLSGRPVQDICQALGRSEFWFHKWWRRYLESGAEGLYDLTRPRNSIRRGRVRGVILSEPNEAIEHIRELDEGNADE